MLEGHALRRLHLGPIDFALRPGECVSLAGKSGAGKSVLLRMLADLDPHQGDALLDGAACSGMPAPKWRRMVTYVAAESGWWDERVGTHFSPGADFPTLPPAVGISAEPARVCARGRRGGCACCGGVLGKPGTRFRRGRPRGPDPETRAGGKACRRG